MKYSGQKPSFSDKRLFPLGLQATGLILTALVLDGGMMLKCFFSAMLVWWVHFAMKLSPHSRTGCADRFFLQFGIPIYFVVIYVLVLYWHQ